MSPRSVRHAVQALALASLLVTSGCAAVTDFDTADGPDVPTTEEVAAGYRSFDAVAATVHTTVRDENVTTTRARLVQRPATGEQWRETLAPADRAGDLVVSNGSVTWSYDASEDAATRIDASRFEAANDTYADYVCRLFGALQRSDDDRASVGVSPLPVVPATPAPPVHTNGTVGRQTVEYDGTATVDGRTAHVLHLTPETTDGEFAVLNQTVYLDAEYFFPLRQRMAFRYDGNVTSYDVTHRNVTFDPDVEADRFRFDPPTGTNVSETTLPRSTTYESLDALEAETGVSAETPSVPEGFSLGEVRYTVSTERNYTTVAQTYENETGMLSVAVHNTTELFTGTAESENVSLGPVTATYREFGVVRSVQWTTNGSYYSVSSDVLSRAALLDVARSLVDDARTTTDDRERAPLTGERTASTR